MEGERNKSERNRNRYEKARTLGIWKYVLHNTSSFDDFIHLLARLKRYEKTHSKREFFIKKIPVLLMILSISFIISIILITPV